MIRRIAVASLFSLLLASCGATTRPDGGSGLLPIGTTAPELSAIDQNGASHKLADERGHAVVVYFYPKDATPGCTKEACAFRDAWAKYKSANVQVFGVSGDDERSHEQFSKELSLPFPILADPEHRWSAAFGVSTTLGMDARVSFLLDKDGKVARVYPNVDPGVHASEVLADATALK